MGVIFISLDDQIQFTLMMDAGHALDAERQGEEHSTENPLLKSVKKVTGDYPSVYGITEDIIIFMNPPQWKTFLETEKKFAMQDKSPDEVLQYLKKCLNLGDARGA